MSWKYSGTSSYTPRDSTSTRETLPAKFGFSNSKLGSAATERRTGWSSNLSPDSKFHRSFVESIEHSPVWARTNSIETPASVQRLKERYNLADETVREKKTEPKDSQKGPKFYGRSYTSVHVDDRPNDSGSNYSKFRRKLDKPSIEKKDSENYVTRLPSSSYRSLDPPKSLYIPDLSRSPARRYTNDLSPTIPTVQCSSEKTTSGRHKPETDEIVLTVVTRGTSPTPTASTVYLRSKRTDYGIEKRMTRPRKKPEMVHREIQTDKEEVSLSKYSTYCDNALRSNPWSSYSSSNSYASKYSNRTSHGGPRDHLSSVGSLSPSECRRSVSREESDDPESPLKSPTGKPPLIKEPDRKFCIRKSPPSNFRLPLKPETPKPDVAKSPGSPASPLQCKIAMIESPKSPVKLAPGVLSPTVSINRCPDIMHAIADASSASESSEEESSSEDDSDEDASSPALTIKKSITNFLQNIPLSPTQRQTRSNLYHKTSNPSCQKINFRRIESGEKAWWMESTDKVPDGVTRTKSTRSVSGQSPEYPGPKSNNLLSPPYNTRPGPPLAPDRSRTTCEEENPRPENLNSAEECNGLHLGNGYAKGDHFFRAHSPQPVNSFPLDNDSHHPMKFNLQVDKPFSDGRRYLNEYSRECSANEGQQKLTNGLCSPTEEKNRLDPGTMAGLISKMKGELNKPKLDIRKSSSREMSPMVQDPKSEIELYWKELADSVSRPLRLCDLDFTDLNTDDESDILGHLKTNGEIPAPPPMMILPIPPTTLPLKPIGGVPAPPACATIQPPPMRNFKIPPPPLIPQLVKNKKTVKLFWKEVKQEPRLTKPSHSEAGGQIWDELTQVKLDTQKLEHLFESRAKDLTSKKQQDQFKNKEIIVLDPKRSNAINIGMTKLPPPRAIKTAILKMDATVINKEGIEKVLTMLPTEEEKLRIQEAQTSNPEIPLGSAEQFLLTLASISQLEARLRLWAFKLDFENSEREICEPLMDLKQGMEILRVNKTFRGVLSTLLSVGNFLNGCDAKGFQIEYLSKVPEVKDTVHKHSLLHHLCIIVMDKFPESTDLYSEIGPVTRASKVDYDELSTSIRKLEEDCKLSWNYLKMIAKHEGHTTMKVRMSDFLADCAERIIVLGVVHRRIMARFNKFAYWLGVPINRISTTRPNDIFKVVSEFALEYRTTRDRVLQQIKKMNREKTRSRGYLCADSNSSADSKMNSKEAKDDAKLKQLLGKETTYGENMNMQSWRRHRKDAKNILQETNQNEVEILETLIKTANQKTGFKERRRSKMRGKCCKSRGEWTASPHRSLSHNVPLFQNECGNKRFDKGRLRDLEDCIPGLHRFQYRIMSPRIV